MLEFSPDGSTYTEVLRWNEAYLDNDSDPTGFAVAHFNNLQLPSEYLTSRFRLRLRWVTDGSDNYYAGCFVDDVKISKTSMSDGSDNQYAFKAGTSMAAPHVTGAVALAWGFSPTSTLAEIRNAVVNSGDPVSSLAGKTASGKRLNLLRTLLSLSAPSVTSVSTYANSSKAVTIGSGTWLSGSVSPYYEWTSTGGAVSYDVNVDRSATYAALTGNPTGNFFSGSVVAASYS